MPRGQADFGQYAVKEVSASISDMGEVAARLGSILIFDKRGDVILFDAFEEPVLSWSDGGFGVGAYAKHCSDYVKGGSQAVKFHTIDLEGSYGLLNKSVAASLSKRLGFEISFSGIGAYVDLLLRLRYRWSTFTYDARLKVSYQDLKVYYWALAGWTELTAIGMLPHLAGFFNTVKFVIDSNTGYFQRLLLNTQEWDISTIPMLFGTGGEVNDIYLEIKVLNRDAGSYDAYVDDFIITQAEP